MLEIVEGLDGIKIIYPFSDDDEIFSNWFSLVVVSIENDEKGFVSIEQKPPPKNDKHLWYSDIDTLIYALKEAKRILEDG